MAKEYIERNAVIEFFGPYTHEDVLLEPIDVINDIKAISAADVVKVVRCKDCKHRVSGWSDGKPCCVNLDGGMSADVELKDDDFCSYGERRHENDSDSE